MSEQFDAERTVARHIGSVGVSPPSDAFYDGLFTRAGRTRQRPRWLAILKEPPMRYRSHVAFGSPIARVTTFAAVTILVTILGAGALVAGAQSPSPAPQPVAPEAVDPMGANHWTGTYTGTGAELGVTGSHDGYFEEMGGIVRGEVVADDPRIAGLLTQVLNTHSTAEPYVAIFSGTARIDNDAGAWVGTFAAWGASSGGDEFYVLEGEGAYEGLTAAFQLHELDIFKALRVDSPLQGVILPAELPPPPDPVAPPAE